MHLKQKKYMQFLEEREAEGTKPLVRFPSCIHTSPDVSELAHVSVYV